MCRARGAPDCARGERDPREDAAKVAFQKSISLVTLVSFPIHAAKVEAKGHAPGKSENYPKS